MAGSRALASTALLVTLNLLFFSLATSTYSPPPPPTAHSSTCPKSEACLHVLNLPLLLHGGHPPPPCCNLIKGLVELDAAVCLCAALQVKALGINLNVPLALNLLINRCTGNDVPAGFHCTGKHSPHPPKALSPPPPPPTTPSPPPPKALSPPPPPPKAFSPPPPPPKKHSPPPPPPKTPSPPPKTPSPPPKIPSPPPKTPSPPPKTPSPPPKMTPPPPPPPKTPTCPKLNACLGVLNLPQLLLGGHPPSSCCSVIPGLVDLQTDICLCAALKVEALKIKVDVSIALNLLFNGCTGKDCPSTFKCY